MTALVLIPGTGSDGEVWADTIDALGDAATCQVADTLLDDTLAAMAERTLADAPATFALAGVSMGGMVALEIMRLAPSRVTALALFDTSARPDTPEQKAYRQRVDAAVAASDDYLALAAGSIGALVHHDCPQPIRDRLLAMSMRTGPGVYRRQNLAVMARADARPVLATIAVPTIVVVGSEDRVTPPKLSEEIAAGVPHAALHTIAQCGHLPPIEAPAQSAALLRGVLRAAA